MKRSNMIKIENYFETFLFVFLLAFFLFLIKGFLMPLLFASALVFLTYNSYLNLQEKVKNKSLSSLIVLLVVVFLLIFPTFWLANSVFLETTNLLNSNQEIFEKVDLSFCSFNLCRTIEEKLEFLDFSISGFFTLILESFSNSLSSVFNSIIDFFVDFFVFILAFFFLLRDGDKFANYIKRIIPMKNEYKDALFIRFRDVSEAVFVNTIFVALIQGILTGFGLWIAGVDSVIFWSVVASFAALLPLFGAALIWGPAAIYLLLTSNLFGGIFLIVYGLVVISISDNLIRPILLRKRVDVHEFLILLSILGGMEVFGFFIGIFLGPILISFLVSVLHLYNLDFK